MLNNKMTQKLYEAKIVFVFIDFRFYKTEHENEFSRFENVISTASMLMNGTTITRRLYRMDICRD